MSYLINLINLKLLILGCGSIGSRHAKNLKSLGLEELILCDKDYSRLKSLGNIIKTNLLYTDYKKAVNDNHDISAAVICTPTTFHIPHALYFAKKKINLFIEKPLSNNLHNTQTLSSLVSSNNLVAMMGHAFMFEPGFIKLLSLLQEKILGKIYFVTYLQGHYLPDWHPLNDYRVEYTAKKELGGGALLTLTSHAFYLIEWLFGKIKSFHGNIVTKLGSLEIDVNDSVFLLMKTKNSIIIQTINNFISRVPQHRIIIEGEKGRIEYDLLEKKIQIFIVNKKPKIININSNENSRYVGEMKYFLTLLQKNKCSEHLNLDSSIRFLSTIRNL